MEREDLYKKLNEIFAEVLRLDSVNLSDETIADDVEGWDSLSHIILLSTIEKKFHIKFNMKEIVSLHNVGELVDLILEKTNL